MHITIILLSFVPAVAWILYFYLNDRYEKEPLRLILKVFILGMLSVFPAIIIELALEKLINTEIPYSPLRLMLSMLMVGLTEEFLKFLAVKYSVFNNDEFNEPMDGIVYCVTSAMGFAFIENIAYMYKFLSHSGVLSAYIIGIMRALFSMFGHATFSVIMGFFLGKARFNRRESGRLIITGLILAGTVHAVYNYAIAINKETISTIICLFCFLIIWKNMNRLHIDSALNDSPFKGDRPDNDPITAWNAFSTLILLLLVALTGMALMKFEKPRTLRNTALQYSLEHPPFWLTSISRDSGLVTLSAPSFKNDIPVTTIQSFDYYRIRPDMRNNGIIPVKWVMNMFTDPVLVSETPEYLGNAEGREIIIRWKRTGRGKKFKPSEISMQSRIVYARRGDRVFLLRFDSREDQFRFYQKTLERLIKSFRFETEKKTVGLSHQPC